jgi:hypothetical protein
MNSVGVTAVERCAGTVSVFGILLSLYVSCRRWDIWCLKYPRTTQTFYTSYKVSARLVGVYMQKTKL